MEDHPGVKHCSTGVSTSMRCPTHKIYILNLDEVSFSFNLFFAHMESTTVADITQRSGNGRTIFQYLDIWIENMFIYGALRVECW